MSSTFDRASVHPVLACAETIGTALKDTADVPVTFMAPADKRSALDSLSKCLGMFVERHELTGKDGVPLMPEASSRDLARAVVAILRDARLEGRPYDPTIDGELAEDPEPSPSDEPGSSHVAAPVIRVFNPATGSLE